MWHSVKSYVQSSIAKLRDMAEEDAPVALSVLISSHDDTTQPEPIPEMPSHFVVDTIFGSHLTHSNSAGSYLPHGRDSITISCMQNPSLQPRSTGEIDLRSLIESHQENSLLTKLER